MPGTSPIEALRLLAHELIERPHPALPLFDATQRFVATVQASEALKARARQMRDELVHALAVVLADDANRQHDDVDAALAAGLIAATWTIAFVQTHALMADIGDVPFAKRLFLDLIDRGITGTKAALAATPYA